MEERLLHRIDLQHALGIGKTTFFKWKKEGLIPPPVLPNRWTVAQLEKILNSDSSDQFERVRGPN